MQFAIAQSTTVCSQIDGTTRRREARGGRPADRRIPLHDRHHLAGGRVSVPAVDRSAADDAAVVSSTPDDGFAACGGAVASTGHVDGDVAGALQAIATRRRTPPAYPGHDGRVRGHSDLRASRARTPTTTRRCCDSPSGPGQRPGLDVGELPPGYLPMTAANGLGQLASYTTAAADAVAAQNGRLPALTGRESHHHAPRPNSSSSTGHTSTSGNGGGGTNGAGGTGGTLGGGTGPDTGTSATPAGGSTAAGGAPSPASSAAAKTVPLGRRRASRSAVARSPS